MVSMQHEIHADAMLLRAMNANATDVELARCCAQTVGAIDADAHGGGGGSKATVLTVVEQTEGALAALEAASALRLSTSRRSSAVTTGGDDAAALEASAAVSKALVELTSGMQLLANLVLLEESVDQVSMHYAMIIIKLNIYYLLFIIYYLFLWFLFGEISVLIVMLCVVVLFVAEYIVPNILSAFIYFFVFIHQLDLGGPAGEAHGVKSGVPRGAAGGPRPRQGRRDGGGADAAGPPREPRPRDNGHGRGNGQSASHSLTHSPTHSFTHSLTTPLYQLKSIQVN